MKNILSFLGLVALMIVVGCTDPGRSPSPEVDGPAIHFDYTDNGSQKNISADATSFDIVVYKTNDFGEAVTVTVSFTDESELFSAPTSVTIPADKDQAVVSIAYDPADLELGEFYPLTLDIATNDENILTPYGPSHIDFTAGIPLIWEIWANGTISSAFMEIEEARVLQKAKGINRFRIVSPFTEGYHFNFNWDIDNKATSIMPIGQAMSLGDPPTPVIKQPTGEPYDDVSSIYLLTDCDETYTFYDPLTQTLTISSNYYVFVDATGAGVGAFGWNDDYFEITEFVQGDPWVE